MNNNKLLFIILFFFISPLCPDKAFKCNCFGAEIEYWCNIEQGFVLDKDSNFNIGYLKSLKIGNTLLIPDINVTNPENTGSSFNVAGVLSYFYWNGDNFSPITIYARVCTENRNRIFPYFLYPAVVQPVDEFEFVVYKYDYSANKYFKAICNERPHLEGFIHKVGGEQGLFIDGDVAGEVTSPTNYRMEITILPSPFRQLIKLGGSPSSYIFLCWGDPVVPDPDPPLPVQLTTFEGQKQGNMVHLNWTIESEIDNLGFILERSVLDQSTNSYSDWIEIASYKTHNALTGRGTASTRANYEFTDMTAVHDKTYRYRLSDVNTAGLVNICSVIDVTLSDVEIPNETELEPSYPNPFNPKTQIRYHLAQNGPVEINIYDILGHKINTLVKQQQSAGSYQTSWNGVDEIGQQAASGMYLIVMKTGNIIKTQKILLMR